jgi:hypothetical protein
VMKSGSNILVNINIEITIFYWMGIKKRATTFFAAKIEENNTVPPLKQSTSIYSRSKTRNFTLVREGVTKFMTPCLLREPEIWFLFS